MCDSPSGFLGFFGELVFAYAADGADPIFRQIFEFGAGSNVVFRITGSFIIYITANVTNVFFIVFIPLRIICFRPRLYQSFCLVAIGFMRFFNKSY